MVKDIETKTKNRTTAVRSSDSSQQKITTNEAE